MKEAWDLVQNGLRRKEVMIIVGTCEVEYRGRAYSELPEGMRILIIKEDSALILHRPRGFEPVNWQPSGSIIVSECKGDMLLIRAFKRRPAEVMEVKFKEVKLAASLKLIDKGEFLMYGSEEDIKKAIMIRPDLLESGLRILRDERKTDKGYIDLCAVDSEGRLVVIELKRRRADKDAVLQLLRYVNYYRRSSTCKVRGVLVSPSISKGALRLLKEVGLEYKKISLKKCREVILTHSDSSLFK